MSTSLVEQLKKLAVPQSSAIVRGKKRCSLLFDASEAAGLNKETLFQIGIDGFEELVKRNGSFLQFESTLFHSASKDFDRSVQTSETNKMLDRNIRKFLVLLSPYILLSCSHKALEWLIYRYNIHEYNKDEILMLILPYHETNIFVRILQLLKIKDPSDKWHWLRPLQKPGVHLTKKALFNHAASDPFLIKFISNLIFTAVDVHEKPSSLVTIFNFYCVTFTGAIEYANNIQESHISFMLPVLMKGISSDITDFSAASLVILARLVAKTTLTDKILDKIVRKLASVKNLKNESVLAMLLIYQKQTHYKRITSKALQKLSEQKWIIDCLQEHNNNGFNINPFLTVFLQNIIKEILVGNAFHKNRSIIDNILAHVKIDEEMIKSLIETVLEVSYKNIKFSRDTKKWIKDFLSTLERQYPNNYDEIIKDIMNNSNKLSSVHQKKFRKVMKIAMEDSFGFFEKLYHPDPKTRMEAIKHLIKRYDTLQEKKRCFIKSVIIDRLNDENQGVVSETLKSFKVNLPNIIGNDELKKVLLKLLFKCQKEQTWWKISTIALDIFLQHSEASNINDFLSIFSFLLPTNEDEMIISKKIVCSEYGKKNDCISSVSERLNNAKTPEKFSKIMLSSLNKLDIEAIIYALNEYPIEYRDASHKYVVSLILSNAVQDNIEPDVSLLLLEVFETFLNTCDLRNYIHGDTVSECITAARMDQFPLEGFLLCLKKLITKTRKLRKSLGMLDFSQNTKETSFYLKLLKILLKGCHSKKKNISSLYLDALEVFVNHFSEDLLSKIEFYFNVSLQFDPDLQKLCLKMAKNLMKQEIKCVNELLSLDAVAIPYLIVHTFNHNLEIRKAALNIMQLVVEKSRKTDKNFSLFIGKLLENEQEIIMDNEQLPLVIYNIFTESSQDELKAVKEVFFNVCSSSIYPIYLSAGILKVLAFVNDFDKFNLTSELALKILQSSSDRESLTISESEIIHYNILRIDSVVSDRINLDSTIWQMITLIFKYDKINVAIDNTKKTCPATLLLNQIDDSNFEKFKTEIKKSLLSEMVKLVTFSQNPEVLQSGIRTFKRIHFDATLLVDFLIKMKNVQSPKLDENKKKRRISIIPTTDILDTTEWKEGITVLEIFQEKKKIFNYVEMLPVLFDLLKKCLDFDEQSNVEYGKQLILSTILHFCSKSEVEAEKLSENAFDMELVVQCIRASQNPQTHHHALLLLSYAASIVPDQVLHHIIAVFTFVGSSVLRHDDAYSFQIISKIIDTIIPLLISDNSGSESIAKILRVFVDAILDIPEHRRMPLFKQLLTRLDLENSLHLLLLLIFEAHVVHGHLEKSKSKGNRLLTEAGNVQKRLDVAMEICHMFTPDILLPTCIKLLDYLRKLPDDKDETMIVDNESYTFDINRHSAKQFRHYKYTLVVFVTNFLSSKEFVEKIASLSEDGLYNLENSYKSAIINILTYIQRITKVADKNINTPQAQYWKVMLHYCYDILDSLNALLTSQMFLLVVRGLLEHSILVVRRRALELLNNKLQNNVEFFSDCDESELQAVIPPLLNIIKVVEDDDKVEADQELLTQTALLSLKLLVRYLAPNDPEKFLYILSFVSDLVKAHKVQENVLASVVLCLAELCANLRAHAISSLNKFMPALTKILKNQRAKEMPSLLLLSVLAAIQKILDSLPLFLSPYLEKLLCEISSLAAKWQEDTQNDKLTPFLNKIKSISHKIGTTIPPRVLIPVVDGCYSTLIERGNYKAVGPLMKIFAENIVQLEGYPLQIHLQELISFFLSSLQFRSQYETNYTDANEVEHHLVQALITLILKLSESSFRPFYYKLYDWAVRTDAKTERIITFYHLSQEIANSLKGLFVLFAGHFLNNAASLMDLCNVVKQNDMYFDEEEKNILLIENILKTLQAIFMYDTQKFMNKERFDVLMQPLVDQLENTLGGIESLEDRSKNILNPCIVNFVVAIGDDALWKQLNYQVMLKTRHTDSKIRLIALDCFHQIVKKVGEDFLPLLPETVPFLAELLEDDEEEVEKSCRKVIQEVEKIVGEPLQKYF